jgi:peptidyl-prolyl cis-trans isomerase SurA
MKKLSLLRFRTAMSGLMMAAGILCGTALMPLSAAQAQSVVAFVNNQPITSFDVQQRIRLAAMTQGKRLNAKSALNDLIDDQVKIIEARRVGYRVTEDGVDNEFTRLAKSNRQTVLQFSDSLRQAGLQPDMLRDNIRANLAWEALLRDRSKLGSHITRSEVESAVKEKGSEIEITQYELVQVLFIVPQGGKNASSSLRAANAARSRFTSCETGFDELRTMQDVAVRETVIRSSADLAKQASQILDKTPVGRMTPPTMTPQGYEVIAVCGKKTVSNPAYDRSNVAAALTEKKFAANSKEYLESLRKKVQIRYR